MKTFSTFDFARVRFLILSGGIYKNFYSLPCGGQSAAIMVAKPVKPAAWQVAEEPQVGDDTRKTKDTMKFIQLGLGDLGCQDSMSEALSLPAFRQWQHRIARSEMGTRGIT